MTQFVRGILYEVDWAAVSTVILTIITGYYAWSTRQILVATARQADVAEKTLRFLLSERSERMGHHSAPLRRVITAGGRIVEQWLSCMADAPDWNATPPVEPEDFFTIAEHALALSPAVHERLRNVQSRILNLRIAADAAKTANDNQCTSRLNELREAINDLGRAWRDLADEVDRLERA